MLGISGDTKALKTRVSFGYGGIALTKIGRVEDFSIGGLNLQGMEAEFATSSWGGKEGGQIGNKVLKNFVVTFDYQNRLITFEN